VSSSAVPYPLVLTAFEVRYPSTPRIEAALPSFVDALSARLPHVSSGEGSKLERTSLGFGAHRGLLDPALLTMYNSRRTEACTVRSNAATLEVTSYESYEGFRELLKDFIGALYRTRAIISVERVGIRYLDELHAPPVDDAVDWATWISPSLLGPLQVVGDRTVANYTGALRLQLDPDFYLSMRWGALRRPALRRSMGAGLRIKRPPGTSPVFMLDLDGSWVPRSSDSVDIESILEATDRLHFEIKKLFSASVTDDLRAQIAMMPPAYGEDQELLYE
jgi:uncharacterized protein (TIGR04255 family)